MIIFDNSTPPYKEPTAPTSSISLPDGRLSTSTTSPPPYEFTDTKAPSWVRDEKHRRSEEDHTPNPSHRDQQPEMKKVYTEHPSEFSRIATVDPQALKPFDPMTIPIGGSGRSLDKGLCLDLPPSTEDIHPFTQRDIGDTDWTRFMQDLRDGTAVSNSTKHKSFLVPLALGFGPGAFFISRAIKGRIRRNKLAFAIDLINRWNQHFFNPRRVEVVLMRGFRPLTNTMSTIPPEKSTKTHHDNLSWVSMSSHYDSSSSISYEERSIGCYSQSKTPLRLVVVSI